MFVGNILKIAVFIGRFQPFHLGHLDTVRLALEKFDKLVVFLGGVNHAVCIRNPWPYEVRVQCISDCLSENDLSRIHFLPAYDSLYNNDAWQERIEKTIAEKFPNDEISIIGYAKDATSFYLELFPNWKSYPTDYFHGIDSTTIRKEYFTSGKINGRLLPDSVNGFLDHFKKQIEYTRLKNWYDDISTQQFSKKVLTYHIQCNDQVFVVKREQSLGKDQWALPEFDVDDAILLEDQITQRLNDNLGINDYQSMKNLGEFFIDNRSMVPNQSTYLVHVRLLSLDQIKCEQQFEWINWKTLFFDWKLYADHTSLIYKANLEN